jgi:hypothetical protein
LTSLALRFRAYRVTPPLFAFLSTITTNLSKVDYHFFCYLLIKTISQYRQYSKKAKGWIPVKGRTIQSQFCGADPKNLVTENLIELDRHYRVGVRSRHFKVQTWVLDEVRARIEEGLDSSGEHYNLYTRNLWRDDNLAKQLLSQSLIADEPPPELITKAISQIHTGYYSRSAVREHLKGLKEIADLNPTETNRFRYLNDWFCFLTVEQTSLITITDSDIVSYSPTYTLQRTGRVSSAMQSCSRPMKFAAYTGIANIHNYDLSSSQVFIAIEEMKKYGIQCLWLEDYISDKNKRQLYADQIGIPVSDWKQCLLTLIMGGSLPSSATSPWSEHSSILQTLKEFFNDDDDKVANALGALRLMFTELMASLKKWHRLVYKEAVTNGTVINAIGIERKLKDFGQRPISPMIAHILQGAEAYYIHTLTTLASEHGFVPIGNEHDGLITIGEIPTAAIEEAGQLTGMP